MVGGPVSLLRCLFDSVVQIHKGSCTRQFLIVVILFAFTKFLSSTSQLCYPVRRFDSYLCAWCISPVGGRHLLASSSGLAFTPRTPASLREGSWTDGSPITENQPQTSSLPQPPHFAPLFVSFLLSSTERMIDCDSGGEFIVYTFATRVCFIYLFILAQRCGNHLLALIRNLYFRLARRSDPAHLPRRDSGISPPT